MKEVLFINGNRNGYHPTQCGETMTVGDLIRYLEELRDDGYLDEDSEIFLRNDNGYTYGSIEEWDFKLGKYDNDTVEVED